MAEQKKRVATKLKKPRGGFTKVYNAFLDSHQLSQYDKMVFIAIKSFADNKTKQAYPSLATISRISGTSISQVRRSIAKMRQMGVLKVESRRDDINNGRMSNLYTLYDSPDMWGDDFSTEAEDYKAVAAEIPDDILMYEYQRRKLDAKKEPISETDQSPDIDTLQTYQSMKDNTIDSQTSQAGYALEMVRNHFGYEAMIIDHPELKHDVDYIIRILYDTLNTSKKNVRVQQTERPKQVVVDQLLKLTPAEILYVIKKYGERTERIKNPKAYLLTQLYEAVGQYRADIKNQVNHDMHKG